MTSALCPQRSSGLGRVCVFASQYTAGSYLGFWGSFSLSVGTRIRMAAFPCPFPSCKGRQETRSPSPLGAVWFQDQGPPSGLRKTPACPSLCFRPLAEGLTECFPPLHFTFRAICIGQAAPVAPSERDELHAGVAVRELAAPGSWGVSLSAAPVPRATQSQVPQSRLSS